MGFLARSVDTMIRGTANQRVAALLTMVAWFAMGAYVLLTLDHQFGLTAWSDGMTAVFGGSVAFLLALLVKAI